MKAVVMAGGEWILVFLSAEAIFVVSDQPIELRGVEAAREVWLAAVAHERMAFVERAHRIDVVAAIPADP